MEPRHDRTAPAFDGKRLSHAYIVGGGSADRLAMAAVCSSEGPRPCHCCAHCGKASRHIHPDITVVERAKDRKEIVVEQIRALKKDIIILPNEAAKKAYVISDAGDMNTAAQNALLQMLEEPPSSVVLILETDNRAALLPTVRSRCVELAAAARGDAPDTSPAAEGMADEFINAVASGGIELAMTMFRMEKLEKEEFRQFVSCARAKAAARLRESAPNGQDGVCGAYANAGRLLEKAEEYLEFNVGLGHISGMLCAGLL